MDRRAVPGPDTDQQSQGSLSHSFRRVDASNPSPARGGDVSPYDK